MISEIYFFRILAKSLTINRILYIFIPKNVTDTLYFAKNTLNNSKQSAICGGE